MELTVVNVCKMITALALLVGVTTLAAVDLKIFLADQANQSTSMGQVQDTCLPVSYTVFNDCAELDTSSNQVQDLR